MMKVTPLAPWSSISFFKEEMLFRLCFPIIVSGYLRIFFLTLTIWILTCSVQFGNLTKMQVWLWMKHINAFVQRPNNLNHLHPNWPLLEHPLPDFVMLDLDTDPVPLEVNLVQSEGILMVSMIAVSCFVIDHQLKELQSSSPFRQHQYHQSKFTVPGTPIILAISPI